MLHVRIGCVLLCWLVAVNLLTFCTFWWDKRSAKKGRWRTRESTLLGMCAIGGAAGGLLAMRLLRHKTRKKPFAIGVPVMLAVQIGILFYLERKI